MLSAVERGHTQREYGGRSYLCCYETIRISVYGDPKELAFDNLSGSDVVVSLLSGCQGN